MVLIPVLVRSWPIGNMKSSISFLPQTAEFMIPPGHFLSATAFPCRAGCFVGLDNCGVYFVQFSFNIGGCVNTAEPKSHMHIKFWLVSIPVSFSNVPSFNRRASVLLECKTNLSVIRKRIFRHYMPVENFAHVRPGFQGHINDWLFIPNTEGWFASLVDHGKVRARQVFAVDVTSVIAFFATPAKVVCVSVCPYNEG